MALGSHYKVIAGIVCVGSVLELIFKRKTQKSLILLLPLLLRKLIEKFSNCPATTSSINDGSVLVNSITQSVNSELSGTALQCLPHDRTNIPAHQKTMITKTYQYTYNGQIFNENRGCVHNTVLGDGNNIVTQGDNNSTGSISQLSRQSPQSNIKESNRGDNSAAPAQNDHANTKESIEYYYNSTKTNHSDNNVISEDRDSNAAPSERSNNTASENSNIVEFIVVDSDNNTVLGQNDIVESSLSINTQPEQIDLSLHTTVKQNTGCQGQDEISEHLVTLNDPSVDCENNDVNDLGGFPYLHPNNIVFSMAEVIDGRALACNRSINTAVVPVDNIYISHPRYQ